MTQPPPGYNDRSTGGSPTGYPSGSPARPRPATSLSSLLALVVVGLALLNVIWGFLRSSVAEAPGQVAIPLGSVYHVVGWSPALLLLSGLAAGSTLLPGMSKVTAWVVSAAAAVTGGIGALFYLLARAGDDAGLGLLLKTAIDDDYEDSASIGLVLLAIFGLLQLVAALAGLASALHGEASAQRPRAGGPGHAYGPGSSARQQHPAGTGRQQDPGFPPPGQQPPPQYAPPEYGPAGQPPQYAQPGYGAAGQQPQYAQPEYGPAGQPPQYAQPGFGPAGQHPQYGQPEYGQPEYGQPEYGPTGQPPQFAQPGYAGPGQQSAPRPAGSQSGSGHPGHLQSGYAAPQPDPDNAAPQPPPYVPQPVYDPQSGQEVYSGQPPAPPTTPTRVGVVATEPATPSSQVAPAEPPSAAGQDSTPPSAPAGGQAATPEYTRTDYGSADYVWEPTYSEAPEYEAKADEEADAPPVEPQPERAFLYETPEWERPQFEPPRFDTGRHPGWDAGYAENPEGGAEAGASEAGAQPPGYGPHHRSIPRAE